MSERTTKDSQGFHPRPVPPEARTFGRFRLLHELGAGATATLFLTTDEMGRLVALKRLHRHLSRDPDFVAMLRDEAHIASRISHPNVCKVLDHGTHDERPFLLMEYVHGESLACLLGELRSNEQLLQIEAAVHLVSQACLGLHAAHEQTGQQGQPLAIVHRDISPANLLISYDGELKLVDFGIATAADKSHHTETGVLKGKLAYMSPEQTLSSRVDRRSDIFSLGAVLYEAVCGRPCFAAPTAAEILRRVQQVDYVRPRTLRQELPLAVERIIERALAPRPEDRYPDAEQLYRDLYHFLVSSPTGMTTRALGELMRRVFARRLAIRDELRALAFSAPEVLAEEQLTLEEPLPVEGPRCEYCGATASSPSDLERHQESCGQRRWWERNFGHLHSGEITVGVPTRAAADAPAEPAGGWLHRLRDRLSRGRDKPNPLVIRLRSIEARLQSVRDHRTSELTWNGLNTLWRLVAELSERHPRADTLLQRLKARILRSADLLQATALEIEASAAYLASTGTRDLQAEIDALELRRQLAPSEEVEHELRRTIRGKRALVRERERVAGQVELLTLRLEAMVDALQLTLGKVFQITSSPAGRAPEADTQITVFIESLVLELDRLSQALREVEGIR